jgi:iron(III) transport system permease protein
VGGLCLAPLARLALEGIAPGGVPDLGPARAMLGDPRTWQALGRTLWVGLAGTALAVLIGTGFALAVGLGDVRAKPALVTAFVLPLLIPPQVTALAWVQAFGPASPLLLTLGLAPPLGTPHPMYSREGIALLLGVTHAPLVFLAVRAGLRAVAADLVEAARACGASYARALLDIVLPLARPALIAGAALAFVSAAANFGIQAVLGIPARYTTLVTLIYQRLADFGPAVIANAAVLSLLLAALAGLGLAAQAALAPARGIAASGAGLAARPLGRWRPAVETALWAYLLLTVALPLAALVATSLVRAYGVPLGAGSITLASYAKALLGHDATARALINSTLLAGASALLLVAIAVPLAYLRVWQARPLAGWLDAAAELAYALPGIVLGIALILLFLRPLPLLGVPLYGTLGIILLGYLASFLALAVRPVAAALRQAEPALDEAARMAGAGLARRLLTVVLPTAAPAAAAGALLVVLTAVSEIQVSVLLVKTGTETLGTVVFFLEESGSTTMAAALGVVIVAGVAALMALLAVLGPLLPRGVLPWRD